MRRYPQLDLEKIINMTPYQQAVLLNPPELPEDRYVTLSDEQALARFMMEKR